MNHITISQLSRQFDVSTRTLRYYEQIGLICSIRPDEYAYRVYDEANCAKLQQILLLRKLRIPVRQIGELLSSDDARAAIEAFTEHVSGIDEEIEALETLRAILSTLIDRLRRAGQLRLGDGLLSDESVRALIHTARPKKEERTMSDLNQANEQLGKLRDVRIIYLPPATVASSHFIGDEPENVAGDRLNEFARSVNLTAVKPDVRMYGFNHPNPVDETNAHGYEFWVTIPDDMEVPAPLTKKRFEGGLYAAHMIKMGDFHEWEWLYRWAQTSEEYVINGSGTGEDMFGCLEEHLNVKTHLEAEGQEAEYTQLDLLIPVRKR